MTTGDELSFVQFLLAMTTVGSVVVGAIVAWRKVGPERTKGIAEAAEKVASASAEFVVTQREEIETLRERVAFLEGQVSEQRRAEDKIRQLQEQRDAAERATELLLDRIEELVDVLRVHHITPPADVLRVVARHRHPLPGT